MGKEMTQEEAEMDFKKNMARIFSEKIPETQFDEESGIITIPRSTIEDIRRRRKEEHKE